MSSYQLRAVRLINFHNFVDETVEIRDGGHLFLLGDNGSGKTTVLDAVHLVLAGGELELNAAARIGGRRDEGRSLQGVVLRYDPERGVRNAAGAIAYAAVELVDAASGRVVVIGVGAEATTMEARVSRWGFVTARSLAEVALLDGDERPLDREALRGQLGAAAVFGQLAGYRKELARRLFGSEAQYDDAVRFWAMAKAYREIVAGARDFGALFARLLPAPDSAVFEEILRTLRAIEDLDVAVRDLDGQRGYVADLAARLERVAAGREAIARFRWLECRRAHDEADDDGARAADELTRWRGAQQRLDGEAEAARLRSARADDVLRRAEADDAAGLLAEARHAESRRREVAVEAEGARCAAAERAREQRQVEAFSTSRRQALVARAGATAEELRAAMADDAELPGDHEAARGLADALDLLAPGDAALPAVATAAAEAAAAVARRQRQRLDAQVRLATVTTQRADAAAAVEALAATTESAPAQAGHDAARRALAEAGIAARPLFELLEPAPDAAPATLAAIESLVGDEVLGALLVAEDQRARARAVVAAAAPGVRVVVATVPRPLPPWCATAVVAATVDAASVLAAALDQDAGFGAPHAPDEGDVALRGLGHRVGATAPRLLGAAARRLAHAARVAAARQLVDDVGRELDDATRGDLAAQHACARAVRVERAVADAAGAALVASWHAAIEADHRAALAAMACADATARAAHLAARLGAVDDELAALRARLDGDDLDELERRLAALRRTTVELRDAWHDLVAQAAAAGAEARAADARRVGAATRARGLADALRAATAHLRDAMAAARADADTFAGDDDALARHVRVTLRGDSFRSLETLRQRIAEEERATDAAADELERDGSRGVRFLAHAARFGFAYDRARNHVEDRRGQPLAGVLAELDRAIAEQRSVINERTRTLMDTLVMGELARHLQAQVHHLHETITGINRVLRGLRFGAAEYQFQVTPRADRAELVDVVRRLSILDEDSRRHFRAWIDARLDELRGDGGDGDGDGRGAGVPALLDYRRWFEFKLRMSTTDAEGVELTQRLRQVGSGGEQGVPNYLLVLALAKLMFDAAGAAVRPLLFDEAFYGIDASRRDQLLRLATDLGLQLLVASPDQDGARAGVRAATTVFVIKDADHDVHLAPYHFWNHAHASQSELFAAPPPDPADAVCRT